MILAFKLSMPSSPSWNGKWSGEGNCYAKIVNLGRTQKALAKATEILKESPYCYRWEDGWCASVKVEVVDAKEANRIRKASQGFCGYDWMIDSIRQNGFITTD